MNFLSNIKYSFIQIVSRHAFAFRASLIVFAYSLIVSCADDLSYHSSVSDSEYTTLSLIIPDVEGAAQFGATRSDDFQNLAALVEAEEGIITSLWFYAFPTDGSSGEKMVTSLNQHSSLNISDKPDAYKKYTINNFKTGEYHLYLLANLDSYMPQGKSLSELEEADIQALVLNFNTSNKLEVRKLPMYCLHTQMKKEPDKDAVDPRYGNFTVEKGTEIYADMTFLCAKVRYTVLFDKTDTGFSNQFATNNVSFSGASAHKLAYEAKLIDENENHSYVEGNLFEYTPIALNAKIYPGNGSDYFDITKAADAPANLINGTHSSGANQRAWQGVVYLPENLSTEESGTRSYISLSSDSEELEGLNLQFKPLELKRGEMYDLVAKLKKSDVDLEVKVSEWTTQKLAYSLHGPYTLIVEHTDIKIEPGFYHPVGYDTTTDIVSFDIPQVTFTDEYGVEKTIDFYEWEFIDETTVDENGDPYELNPDFHTHFRIRINKDVPFHILYDLEHQDDPTCKSHYDLSDYNYFHIVAGNLHKKITTTLGHSPFLHVTPELMTVEVLEYYNKGINEDNTTFKIHFRTNYDLTGNNLDFFLVDRDGLVAGLGENLEEIVLKTGDYVDTETTYEGKYSSDENDDTMATYYAIHKQEGELVLNLKNMIGNHEIWAQPHEFELKFYLRVRNPHNSVLTNEILERYVKIIVRPYNSNYIIHFYDATHTWVNAHVYIYQDLLLPGDLKKADGSGTSYYAGKIVGYIEENNGLQYNAAVEYAFTNNISFRGWKGYGGPDINDPNLLTEPTDEQILNNNAPNCGRNTEGFVMFGQMKDDGTWNDDYGYTVRTSTSMRHQRYNYDLNFNDAHVSRIEKSSSRWQCQDCLDRNEYINIGFQHDYPGIIMEKEDDNPGWWRYTLTGVAQAGKTMIIFANSEAPWDQNGGEAQNRYPGAYNTGLTLFDFEDNEGWFVYKGENTEANPNVTDHFFYDDKPAGYN